MTDEGLIQIFGRIKHRKTKKTPVSKILSNKPTITRKELESVLDCLINDELQSGQTVHSFESSMTDITGSKHALAVNSLTSAYHLAFKALEVGPGDEVIIPSFFCQAPLSALGLVGGTPVFADNEQNSLFPSVLDIKGLISEKTKAIVTGHLFGFTAPVRELIDCGVVVIEDISHAIGAVFDDVPAGQSGNIAVSSFDPNSIITTGNGGMVLTSNSRHHSAMRDLRGAHADRLHYEYTMTEFQAAMGTSQLFKLATFIKRRREIARVYQEALKITSHRTPLQYSDQFAYQSFPILFDSSIDKVERHFKKARIEMPHSLPKPLHVLAGHKPQDFPNAERLSKKLFSAPLYPTLSKKDIEKIAKALSGFI